MDIDEGEHSILVSQEKKYDVFISFRGEDTRRNIVSFLDEKLKDNGIEAYIDHRLERGEEISKALLDAIDHSKISIVIFSKHYATSPWCLNELDHIIECFEKKMQIVLPVFYDVDPTNVRNQKRSYADAFLQLEHRFPLNQIQKWKTALTKAANLSGWDSSHLRSDAQVVEELVKHIKGKLKTKPSINYLEQGLVGMHERVEDVKELLKNGSKVGICGMGGLGKTTLAEAVINECRHQFDLHHFLPNVREEIEKHGEAYLVEKMVKGLLNEENGVLNYAKKKMLHQKKLLLVLDDVDSLMDYEALLKDEGDWFNSESKVIITSRDKQVLRNICNGNENIYNLQLLDNKEAVQLFYLRAFKGEAVKESYIEISRKFVDYANGVPLALKVLGSHLYRKGMNVWQSFLSKLKHVEPDQRVQKVLKVSFDGLEEQEKSIFLDLACFFRGHYESYVKQVLDACYCSCDVVIEALLDKCLITRSKHEYWKKYDVLQMHDLLQEMGHSIVRGSHGNCLENHSRLWRSEDIYHVLKNNIGSTTLKGVFQVDEDDFAEVINLDVLTFENVPCLRMLKLLPKKLKIRFEFHHDFHGTFPDQLRYLEWHYYPLASLGSKFKPQNLVYLSMVGSELKKLWNETQDVKNLKHVNLSQSKKLTCLPNLSKANLQVLCLRDCTNLVDLPPLKFHDTLDNAEKEYEVMLKYNGLKLQLKNNHKSSLLNYEWRADKVYSWLLDLKGCTNLRSLSTMSGNIKFICLRSTAIEELHSSIGFLKNLLVFDLCDCKYIKNLPTSIRNLESLEYLDMFGCVSIEKFPELPKSIKGLDLSRTSIQKVDSSSFECLPCLRILYMNSCAKLESLPTSICKLESLVTLDIGKCSRLKSFPDILEPMEKLQKLYLYGSGIEEMPSSIENLVVIDELSLCGCENLKCIPTTIYKLKSLITLDISFCSQLKIFPEILEPMENLEDLSLHGSGIEVLPPSIECLVKLTYLSIYYCKNLKSIPTNIFNMCSISEIHIDEAKLHIFPYCGFYYSLIVSSPSEITASQLWTEVEQFKCRNSRSMTSINVLFRLHYSDGLDWSIPLTCCECFLFYSLHNILATQYFKNHIFRIQDIPIPYKDLYSPVASLYRPGASLCLRGGSFSYSGNAIPEWCTHQSAGSSIEVNLVPSLDKYFSFLGFVMCIVVDFDQCTSNPIVVDLNCEYHFKSNDGQISKFHSILPRQKATHDSDGDCNVFTWYLYDYDNWNGLCGVDKAFFEFHFGGSSDSIDTGRIKQCGVRLVYREDAKEFDRAEPIVN